MRKVSYSEKLKDPRWDEKRKHILAKHGEFCESCGETELRLHVHHNAYFKGLEPWEYEDKQFSVLCELCHERYHKEFDPLNYVVSLIGVDKRETRTRLAMLIAGFLDIDDKKLIDHVESTQEGWFCYGVYFLKGFDARSVTGMGFTDLYIGRLNALITRISAYRRNQIKIVNEVD